MLKWLKWTPLLMSIAFGVDRHIFFPMNVGDTWKYSGTYQTSPRFSTSSGESFTETVDVLDSSSFGTDIKYHLKIATNAYTSGPNGLVFAEPTIIYVYIKLNSESIVEYSIDTSRVKNLYSCYICGAFSEIVSTHFNDYLDTNKLFYSDSVESVKITTGSTRGCASPMYPVITLYKDLGIGEYSRSCGTIAGASYIDFKLIQYNNVVFANPFSRIERLRIINPYVMRHKIKQDTDILGRILNPANTNDFRFTIYTNKNK